MDIMEIYRMTMTDFLPVGVLALCVFVITAVVHIAFAMAVFWDATHLPALRKPIFVGAIIWFLGTLTGGVFVAGSYWIMHHSRLNQSVPVTPPEN